MGNIQGKEIEALDRVAAVAKAPPAQAKAIV
jgi:hypothetical protein